MSVLDELRREAEAIRDARLVEGLGKGSLPRKVELAMRHAYGFLLESFKQLDVICPASPTRFVIPQVGVIDDLRLAETFIDYRKKFIGDREYFDRIQALITWGAEKPLEVSVSGATEIEQAHTMLWSQNVRYEAIAATADVRADSPRVLFRIPRRVVADLTITVDHEHCCLNVRTRNLFGFGEDAFTMPADDTSNANWEALVSAILGRRSSLTHLRPGLRLVGAR
jgi:hypothetical protein